MELTQLLKKYRTLPYLDSSRADSIFPVIGALCSGGLSVLCLGAGNEGVYEALSAAAVTFDSMMLGAEVCDMEMAQSACRARAKFIISPGLSEEIAQLCSKQGVRYIPGCATPTEIMRAQALGLTTVMLCPAQLLGGEKGVNLFVSMFPRLKFIVHDTGADCAGYLDNPRLLACVDRKITEGQLDEIALKSRDTVMKYEKELL